MKEGLEYSSIRSHLQCCYKETYGVMSSVLLSLSVFIYSILLLLDLDYWRFVLVIVSGVENRSVKNG